MCIILCQQGMTFTVDVISKFSIRLTWLTKCQCKCRYFPFKILKQNSENIIKHAVLTVLQQLQ